MQKGPDSKSNSSTCCLYYLRLKAIWLKLPYLLQDLKVVRKAATNMKLSSRISSWPLKAPKDVPKMFQYVEV